MTTKRKPAADHLPGGRPSLYDPAHCATVVALGKEGKSVAQMCAHFDIGRSTIDDWASAHPEFSEALTRARVHMQAKLEGIGFAGMTQQGFNAAVWKKTMEARFRDDYTERRDVSTKLSMSYEDALAALE